MLKEKLHWSWYFTFKEHTPLALKVLLTQLGKSDQVGTRWQRSRRIRMIMTQDCRPLALALRAIQNQVNHSWYQQKRGRLEKLKHHCPMEAQKQKKSLEDIPGAAIYRSILCQG